MITIRILSIFVLFIIQPKQEFHYFIDECFHWLYSLLRRNGGDDEIIIF